MQPVFTTPRVALAVVMVPAFANALTQGISQVALAKCLGLLAVKLDDQVAPSYITQDFLGASHHRQVRERGLC